MSKRSLQKTKPEPTRKQLSRLEHERRVRRAVILGTAAVLGLVVLVLAWGLYDQFVRLPRKPVATVAGIPIRVSEYNKLLQYRRWDYRNYLSRLEDQKRQVSSAGEEQAFLVQYIDQQIDQVTQESMNLPTQVLDDLIDDQIMRQEAQRRGIVVSQEEIETRLEEQFGYDRNPPTPIPTPITSTLPITVTPTPTTAPMTYEEFTQRTEDWFRVAREATGFTEADFRHLLESSLYREKVSEVLRAEAPTTAEQVHAQHILVETREEAQAVLDRLANGETFDDLAAELSLDESNKDQGGDLGWFGRGRMVAEFEETAFGLAPGETSGIVETQFGFHIIRVIERDANRQLEGAELSQAQNQYVDDWLSQRRESPDVVRFLDSKMIPTEIPTRAPQRF
jgi:parvulin-like peptidyl-prolyl isomerase